MPQASTISEDFQPTDEQIAKMEQRYPACDIDLETEKFIDHFLATGKKYVSWEAAWRNWIRRSVEYNPAYRTQGSGMGRHTRTNLQRVSEALRDDAAGHHAEHDQPRVVQLKHYNRN